MYKDDENLNDSSRLNKLEVEIYKMHFKSAKALVKRLDSELEEERQEVIRLCEINEALQFEINQLKNNHIYKKDFKY